MEVKSPGSKNVTGFEFAWQSLTYALSEFDGIRPAFVMMFPGIRHFLSDLASVRDVQALLLYGNVGQLELGRTRETQDEWTIKVGPTYYFSVARGLSQTPNALLKRRVGNC
jgi:hypothetical protein